jgi:hypothetical protein
MRWRVQTEGKLVATGDITRSTEELVAITGLLYEI